MRTNAQSIGYEKKSGEGEKNYRNLNAKKI
jgi:hypothetical protein